MVVATEEACKKHNLTPLARVAGYGVAGTVISLLLLLPPPSLLLLLVVVVVIVVIVAVVHLYGLTILLLSFSFCFYKVLF